MISNPATSEPQKKNLQIAITLYELRVLPGRLKYIQDGIPTIPRHYTYRSIESYILDILQCHDNRICYQPNAIHTTNDGEQQLAALTMMRGLLPQPAPEQYIRRSRLDLEWACSFPIEMQTPPYWLTGRPIDDIEHGEHLQTFKTVMSEFIDAFEAQEKIISHSENTLQTNLLRKCWAMEASGIFKPCTARKECCVFLSSISNAVIAKTTVHYASSTIRSVHTGV
ncbi:hypothetical protein ACJ73_10035 [Blastomyces percursus]|uniref:Uncharacterized protein n=1 Tax=Blastomyces percursus TaxID=1658174 RepID=A0A1J9P0Z2_9EURO|nr:hypothetical protein ACJ73_10035 [Blastomyces percursus]